MQGIKPDVQTGTPPANAIRASRMKSLQQQAVCKTASPLKLHAAESCFPGDVHVRPSLSRSQIALLFCKTHRFCIDRIRSAEAASPTSLERDLQFTFPCSQRVGVDEVGRGVNLGSRLRERQQLRRYRFTRIIGRKKRYRLNRWVVQILDRAEVICFCICICTSVNRPSELNVEQFQRLKIIK